MSVARIKPQPQNLETRVENRKREEAVVDRWTNMGPDAKLKLAEWMAR